MNTLQMIFILLFWTVCFFAGTFIGNAVNDYKVKDAPYTLRCSGNELSRITNTFPVQKYTQYEGGTMITFTDGREILLLPGASCSIEENKK